VPVESRPRIPSNFLRDYVALRRPHVTRESHSPVCTRARARASDASWSVDLVSRRQPPVSASPRGTITGYARVDAETRGNFLRAPSPRGRGAEGGSGERGFRYEARHVARACRADRSLLSPVVAASPRAGPGAGWWWGGGEERGVGLSSRERCKQDGGGGDRKSGR